MKLKEIIKNIIIWLIVGVIASIVSNYIIEVLYFNFNFEHVSEQITEVRPEVFLLGSGILFVLYTLFTSLFGSTVMGSIVLISLSGVVGFATNLKREFRGEPIYPNEIYWLEEFPFLFEMIGTKNTLYIVGSLIALILLLVVLYKIYLKPRQNNALRKVKNIARIIGIVLSVLLLFYISRFNYPENKIRKVYNEYASWTGFSQLRNYNQNGFVAGFLYNFDVPSMDEPTNYSRETIENIFEEYKEKSIDINHLKETPRKDTNVIFVMNESFTDPFNLEGIESNKDPIPYYRELASNTLSGSLLVPGIGGGTANTEFQVLTGVSMEPLSPQISNTFVQMAPEISKLPSIVNKMRGYNYDATAIHSYVPTFYRRQDVYDYLNFEEFFHNQNMKHTDTLNELHPYISDKSTYKEMFEVMEKTDGIDYIHIVTMQNHGGYLDRFEELDFEVTGSGDEESAKGYFQGLEQSDIALREMIDEFENYPEPVLLLFWGDHLPGLYQGRAKEINSPITRRETPFLIYSNEFELEGDTGMISPIFLNNYIVDILDMEVSPFEALMLSLEESLSVVDKRMLYDNNKAEAVMEREELSPQSLKVLEDYTLLLYDLSTGNNYAGEMGFFDYFDN